MAPHHRSLGRCFFRQCRDTVVIQPSRRLVHAVLNGLVVQPRNAHRRAVGQVAAVCQRQAHHGVAGPAEGDVHCLVGGRTGVGLHVHVFGAEQISGALGAQLFEPIDLLLSLVVALTRVPFRVLVGQHRAGGLKHRPAGVILRGDQADLLMLAAVLCANDLGNLRVELGQSCHLHPFT